MNGYKERVNKAMATQMPTDPIHTYKMHMYIHPGTIYTPVVLGCSYVTAIL